MDVDLNLSLSYMNISNLMAHISTIDNTSEKVEKLKNYADELNVELIKIKDLKCHSPLCMLNLTEAIEMLKKEILLYTGMATNAVTKEFMPLKGGEPKEKNVLQESSDADKKNWASFIQLGNKNVADKNSDITKQGFASHGSLSGLIREDVAAHKNSYSRMYNNFNSGKRSFVQFQRPPGVTIRDMPYINNGQYSSVRRVGESKGMDMLEETSDAGKKNWASYIQLGNNNVADKNSDITKQGYASGCASHGSSSGLIREAVATYENPYSQMYNNFNNGQRPFVQFQRPPGVIIQENPYINNGQYYSGGRVGETKGMDMLEETYDAGKKSWASYNELGNNNVADMNSDITKQGYASGCASHGSSSGLIRETVTTYGNGQMYNNFNNGQRPFMQFQGPSGVIVQENPYINNGQYSSSGRVGMSSFNKNFSGSFATNSSYQPSFSPLVTDPSKKPRLSWSQNLHDDFLQAVQYLGGPNVATPRKIREHMQIYRLTNDEVKSHLQKYRLHLQKLAASNPTSLAPSSSRSSLTAQGYQANMFTGTVSEYSAHSSGDPLHTRRV